MVPRSRRGAFIKRLPGALRYPLSTSGLLAMLALGLLGAVPLPWWLGMGIYWAYIFSIIRATGRGSREVEVPEFRDVLTDLVVPAVRGAVVVGLVWGPPLVYLKLLRTGSSDAGPFGLGDPAVLLYLGLGVGYAPMALLAAATGIGVLGMLNPLAVFAAIRRTGSDYGIALGALAAGAALAVVGNTLAGFVARVPVPFVSHWAAESVRLYVPFVMARILGLLLYLHGDALAYGTREDYEDPILGNTLARGRKAGARAPAPRAAGVDQPAGPRPAPRSLPLDDDDDLGPGLPPPRIELGPAILAPVLAPPSPPAAVRASAEPSASGSVLGFP
jgi:hypothetical protein